ncbi:hypothetical protein [Megasphaera vaginalis (ex Srinivasan et al. 2021)]|uniref:Putative membrane protein n=1 Tax=Megasphaera vaginalis (ex Srinivasan et al. 2021) TaxID=1111454 RepID=U7UB83_9FIRM|nr:hypothetical protein [Megasphaera vaginalis (ex Srinivasan et al. 2021)]ERT56620.1 putative membrane protein [Megasphaera vaginalis (ex Srinivasan et al. 2021)]
MAEMMKREGEKIIRLWLWILPLPFGAFASDRHFFVFLSPVLLAVSSLILPCVLRRRQMRHRQISFYAPIPCLLYGGIVALAVGTGLLGGLQGNGLWSSYYYRTLLYSCWMLAVTAGQQLLADAFACWSARRRTAWYSEFLDPVLYAVPLPCALWGMVLFPRLDETLLTGDGVLGMTAFFLGGMLLLTIVIVAVFAFYFYPAKTRVPLLRNRLLRLLRVVLMVGIWFFLQSLFFSPYTSLGTFFYGFMAAGKNNLGVFAAPAILECLLMWAAIAIGNLLLLLERN